MKPVFYGGLLACLLPLALLSQSDPGSQDFQCVKTGDNTINLYYGTNLRTAAYRRLAEQVEHSGNIRVSSFGSVGLVYEHVLSDVLGIGGELGYTKTEVRFDLNSDQVYQYKFTVEQMRAMVRLNFHFVRSEYFDAYALLSTGARLLRFSISTNEPFQSFSLGVSAFPFGVKPGLGLRWFFTEYIGLQAEMALGTPLFCGGLSVKF